MKLSGGGFGFRGRGSFFSVGSGGSRCVCLHSLSFLCIVRLLSPFSRPLFVVQAAQPYKMILPLQVHDDHVANDKALLSYHTHIVQWAFGTDSRGDSLLLGFTRT